MKLIASVDSDIGKALRTELQDANPDILCTSRRAGASVPLELAHPLTWPKFTADTIDEVWYTIGIGDSRSTRLEVMQVNAFLTCDFLGTLAARGLVAGAKIVVLSSEWGSVSRFADDPKARPVSPAYRMSKAALNMGVALLAKRYQQFNWILMQPGMVDTKMTRNLGGDALSPSQSASAMIAAVAAETRQFCFIDYLGKDVGF